MLLSSYYVDCVQCVLQKDNTEIVDYVPVSIAKMNNIVNLKSQYRHTLHDFKIIKVGTEIKTFLEDWFDYK